MESQALVSWLLRRNINCRCYLLIISRAYCRLHVYANIYMQVEGAITVQPYAEPVEGFEEYFLGLTPENNQRNPWFTEYWEDYFQCRVRGSIETPFNQNYSRFCDRKLRQTKQNGYQREAQLQFVSDAVLAFAHALKVRDEKVKGFIAPLFIYFYLIKLFL